MDEENMHFDTAVEVCLNIGRDRLPAQSRFKRFQGHKVNKVSLDRAGAGN